MSQKIKNLLLLVGVIAMSSLLFTACQDDDTGGDDPVDPTDCIKHSTNITADETWTADQCHILAGRISVEAGASLTIMPGTVIKGEAGTGPNATALVIARGAKLMAEGTAAAPIIFTSIADEISTTDITAGNFASPNLDPDINGLWGGLIVLGNATISASNDNDEDVSEVQIEGIPTSDTNGLYGGNDDTDNSGVITYVSVRHGGSNIGEGNEINGITLGGVGSGTTIDNVEVVANQDDGIEWFGGTVSVTNAVVWNAGDDAIDTDQAWAGTLDNFVVITPTNSCFELDGPEGTYVARHTITNGSVVAGNISADASLIDTDNSTPVDMSNVHFLAPLKNDNDAWLTFTDDELDNTTFSNITFEVTQAELGNLMEDGTNGLPVGILNGSTPQADVSGFNWTWASRGGALNGL